MTLLLWATVGAVTGMVADLLARRYGVFEDAIVGTAGAAIAGWVFVLLTDASVTSVGPVQALVSVVGAVALIALSRGIMQGRSAI